MSSSTRETILDFILGQTETLRKEIAKLKPKVEPRQAPLTERAQKLQAMIDNADFGCNSAQVAQAFSILTGEDIRFQKKPATMPDDLYQPGVCLAYRAGKIKGSSAILLALDNNGQNACYLSNGKKAGRFYNSDLEDLIIPTKEQITAAFAKYPEHALGMLAIALLQG